MMPIRDYFITFAHYHRWADARLFAALADLSDTERKADRKAFFGSIHGTANHLLVVARAWMGRLEGRDYGIRALDEELYDDFVGLHAAVEDMDDHIVAWVEGLSAARWDKPCTYKTMTGETQTTPVPELLGHLFNHATHHRGQIHHMIGAAGSAPPPLDLIYFLRHRE